MVHLVRITLSFTLYEIEYSQYSPLSLLSPELYSVFFLKFAIFLLLAGNYSSLSFTVHLAREMGFYLMDYFLPSIMIVSISWVSFWLQADASPPRIMLGTSMIFPRSCDEKRTKLNNFVFNIRHYVDVYYTGISTRQNTTKSQLYQSIRSMVPRLLHFYLWQFSGICLCEHNLAP